MYYRFIVATPGNIDDYYKRSMSRVVHLTVNPAFTPGSVSGTDTVCPGVIPDPIYGTLPTGGSGVYTYQWQQRTDDLNWTNIPGATGINFIPDALEASTYFRRIDTDPICGSAETDNHFIEVRAKPVITIQPLDEYCLEKSHLLTVAATGKYLSYQWYHNDRMIIGATKSMYIATQTGEYYVIVSNPCGDTTKSRICEINYCGETDLEIQRAVVILPSQYITNPLANMVTYVRGHKDFAFTIMADPAYSLENIVATTGIERYDKEGIKYNYIANDSVVVTIRQVTDVLTITLSDTPPTVNEQIDHLYKVWSYNERLYFNIPQPAKVWIYTLTGALYGNRNLPAGDYSMPVNSGFYMIVFDNGIRYKISVTPQ
ncbi:MAG: immunoglobulin domain-containing protein [Tannerella sp.]|jgi:hypothetical protein|nr:immunoglobulin domain-containing protein [Tannerella sp.]